MSETKQRLHVRLQPKTLEKIQTIVDEENTTQADAITLAIDHYFTEREEEQVAIKRMISNVMEEKMNTINEKLRTLQVTGNVIDRDTKIQLEFMNHYYLVNNFNKLATTEEYKTKGLQQAEDLIQKRIHKQRKKKLDDEQRKRFERSE